jgi:Tol biopolymer transport system component
MHAQLKPNGDWHHIETRHFNIIYEAGLDSIAQYAAARAELEHSRLSERLIRAPSGRIDIVLANNSDITNGFATPFPSNRVVIWVRPPVDYLGIQYYDDWIDLVVTHELTHSFHMDQAGTVGRAVRAVFGRIPYAWPAFPVIGTPRWNIEGLATLIESQHTGQGRVYGSYHEMVVRTAVLENAFPPIDRVSGESPLWPGGDRAYIYGSLFMDYIARRFGDSAHSRLIGKTKGSILPPLWRMDGVARQALGRSFRDLYADWQADLEQNYRALAGSLRATGITAGQRLTTEGRWAVHPRVAPDQQRIAYADENGRAVTATRIVDLRTGQGERIRRNGIGPVAWLSDNSGFVTAQYEFRNRYEIFSDLFLVRNGEERRLTRGARAEAPDVSPDGLHIVYVQNVGGSNRLMMRELASGTERVLTAASPDAHWTLPRFSPDGGRIAVQKWRRQHGHDVVIIGMDGKVAQEIRTEGTDAGPAWSADGRHVLFASDRTGITNLYAHDVASGELRQVTNVLTGAFYPDVSRDGAWIYYSAYHADGFYIERIPFDIATWRAPQPAATPAELRHDTVVVHETPALAVRASKPRSYSSWPALLPKYWLPFAWADSALGTFIGAQTSGVDNVGRHAFGIGLAGDYEHGRMAGYASYSYAGLGNPVLTLAATRDWDYTGRVAIRDQNGEIIDRLGSYEREDLVLLTASLANRGWRASNSLVLGAEGVVFSRGILGKARFRDPQDKLLGVLAGFGFASARTPALAISPEDGVRGSLFVRHRFDVDPGETDRSYTELSGSGAAYKSTGGARFAHEVLGLRASALHRTDLGRGPTDVGGVIDFLPVRGFSKRARVGFSAWTASLEYRMPLALIARGYRLRPLFVDRISASFFADAGNASCNVEQRAIYLSCPGVEANPTGPLISAGFELSANVGVLAFAPAWLRGGIGLPLRGAKREAKIYLTFAPSF